MFHLRVKICGIKSADIAECAVLNGADALGFIFFEKSPRNISPESARNIIRILPPFINKAGVFVDMTLDRILETIEISGIDTIQLHGESRVYSSSFIEELSLKSRLPIILARRTQVIDEGFFNSILEGWREGFLSGILADSLDGAEYGGTGKTAAWRAVENKKTRDFVRRRIIIAGGINSSNIGALLDRFLPYAVDISSGVEREKGVKDMGLIRGFMDRVRELSCAGAGSEDGALY